MILFKEEHVAPILARRKTQTRRLGKRRWNVGAVHQCRTRMLDGGSTFARVRIQEVSREALRSIDNADAQAEGYDSREEYLKAFYAINGVELSDPVVWVVRFQLEPPFPYGVSA